MLSKFAADPIGPKFQTTAPVVAPAVCADGVQSRNDERLSPNETSQSFQTHIEPKADACIGLADTSTADYRTGNHDKSQHPETNRRE